MTKRKSFTICFYSRMTFEYLLGIMLTFISQTLKISQIGRKGELMFLILTNEILEKNKKKPLRAIGNYYFLLLKLILN